MRRTQEGYRDNMVRWKGGGRGEIEHETRGEREIERNALQRVEGIRVSVTTSK